MVPDIGQVCHGYSEVDDAPCRQRDPQAAMLTEVKDHLYKPLLVWPAPRKLYRHSKQERSCFAHAFGHAPCQLRDIQLSKEEWTTDRIFHSTTFLSVLGAAIEATSKPRDSHFRWICGLARQPEAAALQNLDPVRDIQKPVCVQASLLQHFSSEQVHPEFNVCSFSARSCWQSLKPRPPSSSAGGPRAKGR